MKISALKITLVATLAQMVVAGYLWFLGVSALILAALVIPLIILFALARLLEHNLSRELDESQLYAHSVLKELANVRMSANKDPLTGLNSRLYIQERLDEMVNVAIKRNQYCAVLYLDLDFFKEFNEALGHTLGNQLLVKVAKRLASIVKKGDLLGYNGGDEFFIVLPNINDGMAAELVARRVINSMTNQFMLEGHKLTVSCSIGISVAPNDGADSESLIRHAESALKLCKSNGRKGYSFYSHSLNQVASERLLIDQQLRGALERGEFSLVYQPIVYSQGGKLKGFEALIRWNNPELGAVSPVKFIEVAEQVGLISEIGTWVLREATEQLKAWQLKYNRPLIMSINVSPRQFQDETILPALKSVITQTGVLPGSIQLEVTEGLFLSASDRVLDGIDYLKQSGVLLALDDFGTGFSSLSYLNQLPFNVLKVDKSFVDGLTTNPKDLKMVKAIISIAHGLQMEVVVEGVETAHQISLLRDMKADSIQGFYFSKPLSAKEAEVRFLTRPVVLEMNEDIWDKL